MRRVALALLAGSALCVSPARAGTDDVSVTLLAGPGLLVQGGSVLDGRELSLDGIEVLDSRGGDHGWNLSADVSGTVGGRPWSLRLLRAWDTSGPVSAELPARIDGGVVTVTAAPAL